MRGGSVDSQPAPFCRPPQCWLDQWASAFQISGATYLTGRLPRKGADGALPAVSGAIAPPTAGKSGGGARGWGRPGRGAAGGRARQGALGGDCFAGVGDGSRAVGGGGAG